MHPSASADLRLVTCYTVWKGNDTCIIHNVCKLHSFLRGSGGSYALKKILILKLEP